MFLRSKKECRPSFRSSFRGGRFIVITLLLVSILCILPAAADTVEVTTLSELNNAISGADLNGQARTIVIAADIPFDADDVITPVSTGMNLNLTTERNTPYKIYRTAGNNTVVTGMFSIFGGNLTIQDNGTGILTLSGEGLTDNRQSIIHVTSGRLTILGGNISNNTASMSGGVYVNGGSFTMSGGEISGNTADGSGGGVYVGGTGSFTMSGGKISGNTVEGSGNGGGVFVGGTGSFTMSGGEISGNTANRNGDGVYVGGNGGSFTLYGSAVVDTDNAVYLNIGKFITVPAAFTGSAMNITGTSAVLQPGYELIKTPGSVKASNVLAKFAMADPGLALMANAGNNALVVDKPMPDVASASIAVYNSTAANVTFTLGDHVKSVGAANGAYVNLTSVPDGIVISKQLSDNIAKGETVTDVQLTGLKPGVTYQLNITPLNSTAGGTPIIFTYSTLFTAPVIDRIDVFNGTTKVSGTTVVLAKGDTQTYLAKAMNGTTQIVNESVTWTITSGGIVTLSATTGKETTATAVSEGTETITAKIGSGQRSVFTIRVLDSEIPDTLNLTASPAAITLGEGSVEFTAVLTNSSSKTQYNGIAVSIKDATGTVVATGLTGNTLMWRPASPGTPAFTAVVAVLGKELGSSPVSVTVTNPPHPVPTSGGDGSSGYSSSSSGSISANGQVVFGTGTGITSVSFAKDTTGTVLLETKPEGVSAPANAHAIVDISAPAFEGLAEISFSVPLAVLLDKGLSVNDIVMQHYVNGNWVKVPTFYVGEDRGAAKYVAQTTSFSPFAIVYETDGAQTVERSTPQPTKDAGTDVTGTAKPTATKTSTETSVATTSATPVATGGASVVPTMTQAPVPVAGVLLGLLAAAGVLMRKRE